VKRPLASCAMRDADGDWADSAETAPVQKMAANKVQWLIQKADCYKRTVHDFSILFRKRTFQHDFEAVSNKQRVSYVKLRTILFQINLPSSKRVVLSSCARRDKYSFPTI